MRKLLSNEYNVLTARVLLGGLLLLSSAGKLDDPLPFAASIENYRLVSGTIATVLATVLPWMELLCGISLLSGVLIQGSSLLAGGLLSAFTIAVLTGIVRDLDISCGCFTQDPALSRIGWLKVSENAILLGVTAFLYYSRNLRFSLDEYIRRNNDRESL